MCECYATISKEDPRAEIWKQVSPDGCMPLKHPLMVKNPHFPEYMSLFYVGDADRLTQEQKEKMASLMAEKFKIPREEMLKSLATGQFHIKSNNISVVICELHTRCMI